MRRIISDRQGEYTIDRSPPSTDAEPRVFTSHFSALHFLRRFCSDPLARANMRTLFAEQLPGRSLVRSSDDDVIRDLAGELVAGRVRVWYSAVEQTSTGTGPTAAPPPPPPTAGAPLRPAAPATPLPQPEETDFSPDLDIAAIAAVLKEAALDGVPFCEECLKRQMAAA
jgi:hypothetical protein